MAVEISQQESSLWRHRLQRFEAMLTLDSDSISCDEKTKQELLGAAQQGHLDKFIGVVERYCFKNNQRLCLRGIVSPSRNSLLHVAAGLRGDGIMRAIVGHFPDQLKDKNCRGDTALHLAARAGTAPVARVLLCQASDIGGPEMRWDLVQVKNGRGNTPLHEAVINGHLEMVQILIGEDLQPMYWENKGKKCPLSLAVESNKSRSFEVLRLLLAQPLALSRIEGVSPAHAAVLHGKTDMLKEISKRNPELFGLRDDRGGTPLHLAAYINNLDAIGFLLEIFASSAVEYDNDGHFPIHVACKEGHVEAMEELLLQWPDSTELINKHGQNILHVCAKHGRTQAVKYILGNAKFEKLINERDNDGNTPLHLATLPWHPVALLYLLQDKRVDLKLVNNECLTALDFSLGRRTDSLIQKEKEQIPSDKKREEQVLEKKKKRTDSRLQKRLPSIMLKSAGAPTSEDLSTNKPWDKIVLAEIAIDDVQKGGVLKDLVDTRVLLAILVATVTFAAGFAVPGGFKDAGPDAGMAQLLKGSMFHAFVICNSIAMYLAIGTVLIWPFTYLVDSYVAVSVHLFAAAALLVSCGTMSVAFVAGSYVIVSKLTWLASLVLLLGAGAIACICILYMALCVPLWLAVRHVRCIAFHLICLAITMSRCLPLPEVMDEKDEDEDEDFQPPDVMEDEDSPPAGKKETRTKARPNLYRPGIFPVRGN